QSQNRQGARPHRSEHANRTRRRADRIVLAMSAIGPKRTWLVAPHMSAFGGKADIARTLVHVYLTQTIKKYGPCGGSARPPASLASRRADRCTSVDPVPRAIGGRPAAP